MIYGSNREIHFEALNADYIGVGRLTQWTMEVAEWLAIFI